jgi:hypothetical protein
MQQNESVSTMKATEEVFSSADNFKYTFYYTPTMSYKVP